MNNEDIVSLMERYKRELLEFEKRNTAPVSAQEKVEPEPVSAQQESQAEQVSAQIQEDAEPVNAPAAEPAKAVSAKAKENEAVSIRAAACGAVMPEPGGLRIQGAEKRFAGVRSF